MIGSSDRVCCQSFRATGIGSMLSLSHHAASFPGAMELAVMEPTDWHDELVAHSASEGTRLREGEVVWVRRHTATHEAGLPQYESAVVLVAPANRFAESRD